MATTITTTTTMATAEGGERKSNAGCVLRSCRKSWGKSGLIATALPATYKGSGAHRAMIL